KLLEAFVSHPRRVLSRDQLLDITAGREWSPYDRSIDTQVRRLRQKLGGDAGAKDLIKTVRGAGYLFTAQVDRCDG
ncbi:MAG: helix-turn-helix domain-containing protein, partial [Sphingomonadales bacterium]|nr:helix-turn-helix domain-containing protein [Sphingomonadales bacterium]